MDMLEAGTEPPQSIALCLSGGGLRATFFHLGVITALREAGLLERVTEVFSVSGGSITAAHLALHWNRYTSSDQRQFLNACSELRAVGSWDIRNRVVRRWVLGSLLLLPYWKGIGRTEILQKQYEKLFRNASLRHCLELNPGAPKFYILSTSFNTGDLCSFSDDHFIIHGESTGDEGEAITNPPVHYPADNVRLSVAVAASSAFPPLFPPMRLTWDKIGASSDGAFSAIALTDGGVYDNLGFDKFAALDVGKARQPIDTVVVSDAGGAFNASLRNDFSGVFARNVRATDVLMRRTSKATLLRMREMRNKRRVLYVPIGQTSTRSQALVTTQTRLQNIRTDLDRFSDTEIALLVDHGRDVTRDTLEQSHVTTAPGRPTQAASQPGLSAQEMNEATARGASVTRIGLLDSRDWASYALVAAAIGIAALVYSGGKQVVVKINELLGQSQSLEIAKKYQQEQQLNYERTIAELRSSNEVHKNALITALSTRGTANSGSILTQKFPDKLDLSPPLASPQPPQQAPDKSRYTVWIQFAGTLTREQMKGFGSKLSESWPNTPGAAQGGERIGIAAGRNEVRYRSDRERDAAQMLADEVNAARIVPARVVAKPFPQLPPNSLEIWISN
ncbi:patatin-like phospholipase family protein [Bosea sp. NPDC003192]|uniref:patatin-like phospholipase family protein n=1 Tax=Bosea sp. NPDC003192 TaxID=3390551 RepID=UPI003CFEB400